MRRIMTFCLAASLAVLGTSGCNNFLSSDNVKADPNNPVAATADQLYIGVQAGQFAQQEGIIALIGCMWIQQCTGTSNFLSTLEKYNIASEDTPSAAFSSIYEGGGLVDIKKIEALETAAGNQQFLGIVQVWEALTMAVAADIYGDVPYREAIVQTTPKLDPQAQVYSDLQALLDQAITNLGGTGPGPVASHDLVYGGNTSKWIEAAHTLKARLYMHTAETATGFDNTALNNAVTNALLGISSPANDFKSKHTSQPGEDNLWYQFYARSGFGRYVVTGRALADVMVARNDPRLPQYFGVSAVRWQPSKAYALNTIVLDANLNAQQAQNAGTSGSSEPVWASVSGATTTDGTITWKNIGPPYGGQDPVGARSTAGVSALTGTRNVGTFSQPIVTYIENELILAEAYYRLGQTAFAQTRFNNARASVPATPATPTTPGFPALGPKVITSINDIMEEKYIAMYQNIEVWNDYKRSCYPAITAYPTATFSNKVPGRLYYGTTEQNANPNVPDRNVQNVNGGNPVTNPGFTGGFRNPNDPNAC